MSCENRTTSTVLGGGTLAWVALISVALASGALVSATPARADGMPDVRAEPAPRRHVVHHAVHPVHRRAVLHAHRARPLIGFEIKHVHEDLGAVVYAQPAWPACRYVLDTFLVQSVRDSYVGHFDCGS